MYLTQLSTVMNQAISSKLTGKDFTVSIHGISKQQLRTDTDNTEIPLYIDDNGEGFDVSPNDRFACCIYHKCEGLTFTEESALDFGDGSDFSRETAQMVIVVWADRTRVRMTQETLTSLIASSIPSGVNESFKSDKNGLTDVTISSASSTNDSNADWRREFVNIENALKPEHIFFRLSYTIETVIQKSCIEVCHDC